jgi:hypothetical protein
MTNAKKMQKPQGHCVFCNATGMTKQHMWPAWLRRDDSLASYTNIPGGQHHRNIGDRWVGVSTSQRAGRLIMVPEQNSVKDVHPGTHKFFNVCGTCNSGWMSNIEGDCRPIVKQLILDKATLITQEQQIALAKWATLMAIMAEFTYLPNKAITDAERVNFYIQKEPANNFNIFLGKYQGTFYKQQYLHTAHEVGNPPTDILKRPDYALHADFQVSIFIIGSLLLYVASTSYKPLQPSVNLFAHAGLTKLWPGTQKNIEWQQLKGLNDMDVAFLYRGAGHLIYQSYKNTQA